MAGPDYGALGATFKIVRVLQAISMIAMIGMTANFISQMVSSTQTPSDVLIGTLSVVCPITPTTGRNRANIASSRCASQSCTALSPSFSSSTTSSPS